MTIQNQYILLSDGRRIGFAEYGCPEGNPIFYIHGTPSARVEANLFIDEDVLQALNIRLIAFDRPGMGLSDYMANRRINDFPDDLAALANHLNIDRFGVLAYSGGGPYGAISALYLPERITRVGIVSGAGPFDFPGNAEGIASTNRQFLALSHQRPWLSRLMLQMMGVMCRFLPQKVLANASTALPPPDVEVFAQPAFQKGFLMIFLEAIRQGPRGAQHDTRLMVSPWDFHPHDITIPVHLWHGEQDQNAPIAMGRYMAENIPNSRAKFFPGEGHLSLFVKYFPEIIQTLLDGEG